MEQEKIVIRGLRQNNLKNVSVNIPLNVLTVITGVAGSGKSSLIRDVFARQYADRVVLPVVRSSFPERRRKWKNTLAPSQQNTSESPCDFSGARSKSMIH